MLGIRGVTGEIRWSYLSAVVFGPWRFESNRAGGTLTGEIVSVDAYRVTQHPLTAVVQVGRTTVRWPVVTLQIADTSLTATLGPREGSDGAMPVRHTRDGQTATV